MKVLITALLFISSTAMAITSSSPVGSGAGVSNFDVRLLRSFSVGGMTVENANQITELSFRDVALGGSSMFLTVNGKKLKFKLNQSLYINKGYPVVFGGATSASQTGMGVGVDVDQDYTAYSPTSYETTETNSCNGKLVEACRDFSHNGYGYECLFETLTGLETLLVEYSEQILPAKVTLSAGGKNVATIGYQTMTFDKTTLSTISFCDANDFNNERETIRRLREELQRKYGRPKEPKKIKTH